MRSGNNHHCITEPSSWRELAPVLLLISCLSCGTSPPDTGSVPDKATSTSIRIPSISILTLASGYQAVSPCAHLIVATSPSMRLSGATSSCCTIDYLQQPVSKTISSTCCPSTLPLRISSYLVPRKGCFSTTQHHLFSWTVAVNVTFLFAVKAFDWCLPPMLQASGCYPDGCLPSPS